jgi:tetratricopeptide (TPR) repeat protein
MPRRSKLHDLLDFEIQFYEKLLKAYPDFIDVLVALGSAYTRRGLHEQGLRVDLRLAQLRGEDPITWYNLACSYSLLKRVEEAMASLRESINRGYRDLSYMQKDPDLLCLRQSPKYRQLLESLTASSAAHSRPVDSTAS